MADDKTKTAADRQRISLEDDDEVRNWTKALDCTEEALRKAVAEVGNSAAAVRSWLGKK